MKKYVIDLNCPKNVFQIVVLGDMHIGDECCDMAQIERTINYIKTTKYCYCILNGDLMNNALKTSKSDLYRETMSMEQEQDLLIELLRPIRNKILVIASGNHEYRSSLLAGINPLKAVAYALGLEKKLVDNSYVLELHFGKANGESGRPNKYYVYGIHGGYGGGRRAGSTANALEDMAKIVPNADLYVHSHTHAQMNFSDTVFILNRSTGEVREHQRTYHNANAFLKYGGYAEQKGYKPTDSSPNAIVINALRNKGKMSFVTNTVKI